MRWMGSVPRSRSASSSTGRRAGGFGSLGDLGEVDGIGEKRLQALREALQP